MAGAGRPAYRSPPHLGRDSPPGRLLRLENGNLRFLLLLLAAAGLLLLASGSAPLGPHRASSRRGTTVISTTTVNALEGKARSDTAVVTELVIDSGGHAKSTTVTRDGGGGVEVTVLESDAREEGKRSEQGKKTDGKAASNKIPRRRRASGRRGGAGTLAAERDKSVNGTRRASSPSGAEEGLPDDWDPAAYLAYHPELILEGIRDVESAAEHYLSQGRRQGLVARRLRVVLRYTACTGLINQHYSHIAALSLAAVLGAEVVLPPAVCRDSFAHYFSVFKEKNEVKWSPVPLESLLDVSALVETWKARGVTLHRTPALEPFPDLTQPDVAFPLYKQPGIEARYVTRLEEVYLKALELRDLMDRARRAVVGHAESILRQDPTDPLPYVVLDLPCSFFMLRTLSDLRLVSGVAQSLAFSPRLVALADKIVDGLTDNGRRPFNGVHLRIEKDARDWAMIMGGSQVVWHNYVLAMEGLGLNSTAPIYAASGMLTYGASTDWHRTVGYLKHRGLAHSVHHKEMYLSREDLDALNSEQKALVDFIVLSQSHRFVGFGSSTFSFYLREFRALQGIPRSSSAMVDASIIGTDALFAIAGTVV